MEFLFLGRVLNHCCPCQVGRYLAACRKSHSAYAAILKEEDYGSDEERRALLAMFKTFYEARGGIQLDHDHKHRTTVLRSLPRVHFLGNRYHGHCKITPGDVSIETVLDNSPLRVETYSRRTTVNHLTAPSYSLATLP